MTDYPGKPIAHLASRLGVWGFGVYGSKGLNVGDDQGFIDIA